MSCLGTLPWASGVSGRSPRAWGAGEQGEAFGGPRGGACPEDWCRCWGSSFARRATPLRCQEQRADSALLEAAALPQAGPGRARGAISVASTDVASTGCRCFQAGLGGQGRLSARHARLHPVSIIQDRRGAGTGRAHPQCLRTLGRASGRVSEPIWAVGTRMPEGPLRDEAETPGPCLPILHP